MRAPRDFAATNHPDGRPAYQRMINKNRIKNIGKFIEGGVMSLMVV
jgi:hypothetical protein